MKASLKRALAVFGVCAALVACGRGGGPTTAENATPAEAQQTTVPANVGDCVQTKVTSVGPRLEGVPDSGSSVMYENGLAQVDYSVVPAINNSQAGDDIQLCLVSIPEGCPPGDERGRIYTATNLRTTEIWTAPDSQHMCGGA